MKNFMNVAIFLTAAAMISVATYLSQCEGNHAWGWLLGIGSIFMLVAAGMAADNKS